MVRTKKLRKPRKCHGLGYWIKPLVNYCESYNQVFYRLTDPLPEITRASNCFMSSSITKFNKSYWRKLTIFVSYHWIFQNWSWYQQFIHLIIKNLCAVFLINFSICLIWTQYRYLIVKRQIFCIFILEIFYF